MANWTEKTIQTDDGELCVLSTVVELPDGRQMVCEVDKRLAAMAPEFADEELSRMIALVD